MSNNKEVVVKRSGGIGFIGIIQIILVIAKILGYINISWFLIFLPTIISVGLGVLIFIIFILFLAIAAFLDK